MEEKFGTKMIQENQLEKFENRNLKRVYTIEFTIPEFTCVCPISGFPDFATLYIEFLFMPLPVSNCDCLNFRKMFKCPKQTGK